MMSEYRMCGTCGFEQDGTLDEADDAHMSYDGAHYAIWYTNAELDALNNLSQNL